MFYGLNHKTRTAHPLADVALFHACSAAELDSIVSITTLIDVAAGRILCHQGDGGDECFVIIDGEVEVTMGGEYVTSLGSGDLFGEMALLNRCPRTATVTTTRATRLLVLTRPEFAALLRRAPSVRLRILAGASRRMRQPVPAGDPLAA
jgi:voltage-gated potassium channel